MYDQRDSKYITLKLAPSPLLHFHAETKERGKRRLSHCELGLNSETRAGVVGQAVALDLLFAATWLAACLCASAAS